MKVCKIQIQQKNVTLGEKKSWDVSLKNFSVDCVILKTFLAGTIGWWGNLWIFSENLKLQLCLCISICESEYIWNIISWSHKCCAILYLGCKFSDYNIHHWSQTPECTIYRCCSHTELMAQQDWHAGSCSPEQHWKEGDWWDDISEEENTGPGT